MNRNQRTLSAALSLSILALATGSTLSIANSQQNNQLGNQADPKPSATQNDQPRSVVLSRAAARSLDLQPGDQELFAKPVTPMVFVEVANEGTFTGQLIVHPKDGPGLSASRRIAPIVSKKSKFVEEYVVDVPAGMSEGEMAALLMATGEYEFVEPNWLRYPTVTPNDSQYSSSWQHSRLQSASAWDLNTGSSEIIVAVCDSGVDLDHPDLAASLVSGYNSATDTAQADGGDVNDINGHGTFVAGCAAARGNNNRGVVGVGWNFSIMPIRVTNNNDGTAGAFDITEGARWAAANGAHVVNASFTGGAEASAQFAGRNIKTNGGLLFWAAGNSNAEIGPNRPDLVLVSSTTSTDRKSGFSNFGPGVDVAAPGSSVRSTRNGGSYGNSSGTSYASPIAAGVGAMIYSVNPEFNGDDVQAILYSSVDDLGASGRDDTFGRGRVNTRKAIENAMTYIRPSAIPFQENFESNEWQSAFVATSGAIETSDPSGNPGDSIALRLNQMDIAETAPLQGRALGEILNLHFDLKSESLEAGDTLLVQYLPDTEATGTTWTTLHTIGAQGLAQSEFVPFDIQLPTEFKWHGAKIRFVALGSDSSDTWLVDNFSIDAIQDAPSPFSENFESELFSTTRWRGSENASIALEDNSYHAEMPNGAVIESDNIRADLLDPGLVFIYFDAWTDESVSPSDELLVEAYTIGNRFDVAGTVLASELSGTPTTIKVQAPFTVIGIDDMRLKLTSTTTGVIKVDNIFVANEIVDLGCGDADFAEPLGTLDFFDISAFLSLFGEQSPQADLNNDGKLDFFDVSDFLDAYAIGCP